MNTAANQPWSQAEQLDPMASMTNSDLNDLESLFEFGDLDLQPIPDVSTGQYGDHMALPQSLSHPSTPFTDISPIAPPPGTSTQDFGGQEHYGMQQDMDHQAQSLSQPGSTAPVSHPYTTQSMYQPSLQQQYHMQTPQYAYTQPQMFSSGHVPPTPNSFDMHGEASRFMQQQIDAQQRAMLEQQRYQLRKDDAIAFTPMVSPAGTPQYHVQPEFAVPGAYFSPLTSPMLHAQNAQQQHAYNQGYYTNPSTAPSSNAASPVDPSVDVDMVGDSMTLPDSATSKLKKSKRKVATPRSIATTSRLRQSPATKPQKRKSGTMLSSVVPASEIDTIMAETLKPAKSQPSSAGLQMPSVFNGSSEDGSISPEPLSESLMGPPPRPGSSVVQSPSLTAQQQEAKAAAAVAGAAATPKSLLAGNAASQQVNGNTSTIQNSGEAVGLDDLQLPEAARGQSAQRPALSQIDTQLVSEEVDNQTPRLTARKTPKLGPLSTPSSARPLSAVASPSGVMSPMSATTPGGLLKDKKGDGKGVRGNKKRGSISTVGSGLASPALRPRISPSIKPLLPEGTTLHSPTHALLLASKSNYQNILEGNHLPGISYPDSLSSGLTSKRTSHKVAEQGRRNRINDALKEMQALVPREYLLGGKKGGSNSDDSPDAVCAADLEIKDGKDDAKSHSSKASTVESANVYIRNMQKRQAEEAAENEQLRRRLEELEKRLTEGSGSGVNGVSAASSTKDSASPNDVKS